MSETAKNANPVLVEVTRGDTVESRHRGAIAVVDATGKTVISLGDIAAPTFPRSALKPIQALPLVESGAADHFGLDDAEVALACASHSGATTHADRVGAWLARVGLGVDDLECGAQVPMGDGEGEAFLRADRTATALYNNCSGKHAGFLTTGLQLGGGTRGYIKPDHPVQVAVRDAVRDLCGADPERVPPGTDGCGIPAPAIPLAALALGMARMARPDGLPPARAAACRRIVAAMMAHPVLVAGKGRFDTTLMTALAGRVASKAGAEGVQVAIVPGAGLGIALKIDDGGKRGAEVAMGAVLRHLGVIDDAAAATLQDVLTVPLFNRAGVQVGQVRPAADLIANLAD